jgi:RNA polymerase-interacting CarD/CdnL/TRCF family regulator
MVQKKSTARKLKFRPNEFVEYHAHGVGKIVDVEEQ